MSANKKTLEILGVTDVREIKNTQLFSDIIINNDWSHWDNYLYWLEDGKLIIVNIITKTKLTFQFKDTNDYVCISAATVYSF